MKHSIYLHIFLIALSPILGFSQDLPKLSELQAGPTGDHGIFKEPWEIWAKQLWCTPNYETNFFWNWLTHWFWVDG